MVRNNGGEPTVWQDILWEFLALGNGEQALTNFRANSGYTPEEGESKAHTFHWVRNLAALGTVDTSVSANHPLSATFVKDGARTYVASNTSSGPLTVTFSTGVTLTVAAGTTATTGAYTWSGGTAKGGTNPSPTASPSPTPTPTVSPTSPPPAGGPNRYLLPGGGLASTAGTAGVIAVPAAGGLNYDGTPHNPVTFRATGLTLTHTGESTAFDLFLDAGSSVGNGTQVRVSYDLTGNGSADRVETYRYFATDPVTGYEHYTHSAGLATASGTLGNLSNGTVTVEVWSAIGNQPTSLGVGNQSIIRLPYTS
jgi:hypothetical protein